MIVRVDVRVRPSASVWVVVSVVVYVRRSAMVPPSAPKQPPPLRSQAIISRNSVVCRYGPTAAMSDTTSTARPAATTIHRAHERPPGETRRGGGECWGNVTTCPAFLRLCHSCSNRPSSRAEGVGVLCRAVRAIARIPLPAAAARHGHRRYAVPLCPFLPHASKSIWEGE
ncbi:hypothetical protein WBK31_38210 [Nonomuraea sp. N2-4H]|uniref:hypothetical protein n=1 Tax=Nonomuraea sp. N2-4H TaxID=3128898 RepID=UPI003243B6A6